MNVINRRTAASLGMIRFFTGRPCKYGHLDYRYVSTGACLSCLHKKSTFKNPTNTSREEASKLIAEARKLCDEIMADAQKRGLEIIREADATDARNRKHREESLISISKFHTITLQVPPGRLQEFKDAVEEAGARRLYCVSVDDFWPPNQAGYNGMYAVKVHPEDIAALKAM